MDDMNSLIGFGGLAVIAACWRQLAGFFSRLRSIFFVSATVTGDAASAITLYCLSKFKRSPIGDYYYRSGTAFVRPVNRMQEVAWEKPPKKPLFLFDGWKPILMGGFSHGPDVPQTEDGCVTITVLRWATNIEQLIVTALDEHNHRQGQSNGISRYYIRRIVGRGNKGRFDNGRGQSYPQEVQSGMPGPSGCSPLKNERFLKWEREEIGPVKPESPLGSLAFPEDIKPFIQEFSRWKQSEAWYRLRQVPWRRGWLLYGPPGTGKSSIVRALAQLEDMPIFSFDLSTLSNEEMTSYWRECQESAPCIALFEDIDAAFDGRKNIVGELGGGLTFDCLLNCLSGVESCDGVFIMVTTNNLDVLDDALKRPGRLDRMIPMLKLPQACLRQIAQRILGEWPEEVEAIMESAEQLTGAQMTERCISRALERYWQS